jgi:gamma-glutamylputrescine oxidase
MPRTFPPSWYRLSLTDIPEYAPLDGSRKSDVCVVGGGFTGLSAALHLAEAGVDVVLVDAGRVADGASGRNGGQIHSGQRQDQLWLEQKFGFERAKILWDMAEEAKALVRQLIVRFAIPCDLKAGVIEAQHRESLMREAAELVEALATRYGYDRVTLLDRAETEAALGSQRFAGAINDRGGGHLDPLRFALGLAKAATGFGATIHENTPATGLRHEGGKHIVVTARGDVTADHVIVATDGRSGPFEATTRRRMVGINSFIVVTEPLGELGETILPGQESAADSRFVVRYWRKTPDGRLLFGGGESNAGKIPADVTAFVRPHLREIYPQLAGVPIAHGWGGVVSVTLPRLPYVRAIAPNVWAAGGYSGQGVALAPFIGKLLAEAAQGRAERLTPFTELSMPALPRAIWIRRSMVTLAILKGRIEDRL